MIAGAQQAAEQLLVGEIGREVGRRPILLWGSRALGTAAAGSDYDVVVVVPALRIPLLLRRLRRLASRLAAELGEPVSVNPIPASRVRRQQSLYAWKVAREARVLAAPDTFDLDAGAPIAVTPAHEFSYLASAAMYLLPRDGGDQAARKALLHLVQLRLMRRGMYASTLEDALARLGDAELTALLSAPPGERSRRVRVEVCAELWPLTRAPGQARLATNLRYVVLAAIRGRLRARALRLPRRVDHALAEAALEVLAANDEKGALFRLAGLLPWLEERSVSTWDAAREAIAREWPDAHPLAAQ